MKLIERIRSVAFRGAHEQAMRDRPSLLRKLDTCEKCGGATQHHCSWVCVDICPVCDALTQRETTP
jgi:hypothetical protein